MLLLYYMEINEKTWISNRHLTLKIVDLHQGELSESFEDNLLAIVTKRNDENKLLKTDYKTYLRICIQKKSIFLVHFSRSSKVHYIVTSHFYMFSLALLT